MRKMLQRGAAPPIHPASERHLLESLGFGGSLEPPRPGELNVRLRSEVSKADLKQSILPGKEAHELDPELRFDSAEERVFLERLARELGPAAARWAVPQASLESLVGLSRNGDVPGRRVDFLLSAPWIDRFVVEVDGGQHSESRSVDRERDADLRDEGIDVVRIETSALAGDSDALAAVKTRWRQPPQPRTRELVSLLYVPAQLHRLVLAILDGVAAGFLTGPRWRIQIEDPLGLALDLLLPYFDLLSAVDRLWAGDVAPAAVVLMTGDRAASIERDGVAYGPPREVPLAPPDLLVQLEPGKSATETLPAPGDVPQIVVRSAYLPVLIDDPVYEGASRAQLKAEGKALEHSLRILLQSIFGKEDFREGQLDALVEILEGRDCAVLLPTGAGKSIVYQLAGLAMPGRTIVIDPLISLMEDQVEGLEEHGIDRVAMISSDMTNAQVEAALRAIVTGDALFVFVTPERLQQRSFRDHLRALAQTAPINLAVVDEAHCVSEWGHDFRTAYLNLGRALREVGRDPVGAPPPILALTGTASRAVLRDVLVELGIDRESERAVVVPRSFDRPELSFDVRLARPRQARQFLDSILATLPGRFGASEGEFFKSRGVATFSGIVFVPHVDNDHGIVTIRQTIAPTVHHAPALYSGGRPRDWPDTWKEDKRRFATSFKCNETPVLVSTKAFGMGIDKPNIRYVVHYGIPGSIESYYQEVGRAGRDRKQAECILLLVEYDEGKALELLDEDLDIGELRSKVKAAGWSSDDDIRRQLHFLLESFAGVASECEAISQVLEEIGEIGQRRDARLPIGDKTSRERALHRLVVLGVVADYYMEWGSGAVEIQLAPIQADGVADHFIGYVTRNQPGRSSAVAELAAPARAMSLEDAVPHCARLLVEFVYDTIVRSRRRAIREMWLAAREGYEHPNGAFRARILDYLTQGHATPLLERLVEQQTFRFAQWTTELESVLAPDQAPELRGATARLLSSYPDHPGLLLARGLSELLDRHGDFREAQENIEAALKSGHERYGAPAEDIDLLVAWLLARPDLRSGGASVAAIAVERAQVAPAALETALRAALASPCEPGLRVLGLAVVLKAVTADLDRVVASNERVLN